MRRLGVLVLLSVLVLGAGCRSDDAAPGDPVDKQVSDVESTLDAIESDLGGGG